MGRGLASAGRVATEGEGMTNAGWLLLGVGIGGFVSQQVLGAMHREYRRAAEALLKLEEQRYDELRSMLVSATVNKMDGTP